MNTEPDVQELDVQELAIEVEHYAELLERERRYVKCLEAKLQTRSLQLAKKLYGVEQGSVVRHAGRKYIVMSVSALEHAATSKQKPWVYGALEMQDGLPGVRIENLTDAWEIPT